MRIVGVLWMSSAKEEIIADVAKKQQGVEQYAFGKGLMSTT
jgi:hypothetical protein